MKLSVVSFVILSLMILAGAEIICRDNQTNEEYVASDSNIDQNIAEFERKINELINKLNNQYNNLSNVVETQLEIIASQQQQLNEQMANLSSNNNKQLENIVTQQQLNAEITTEQLKKNTEILSLHLNKIENIVTPYPTNCKEAMQNTSQSGIYKIKSIAFSPEPFEVFCDGETRDGGWMVVMRRLNGSIDFNRNWNDYKHGFGDLKGEFFIGLDKLHALTSNGPKQKLLVLKQYNNKNIHSEYDSFVIGNENEGYILKNVGNSTDVNQFKFGLRSKFTTKDVDNDVNDKYNCAEWTDGAWWHTDHCVVCTLITPNDQKGILCDNLNLKRTEMLIMPFN